jgi:hypothetical protein
MVLPAAVAYGAASYASQPQVPPTEGPTVPEESGQQNNIPEDAFNISEAIINVQMATINIGNIAEGTTPEAVFGSSTPQQPALPKVKPETASATTEAGSSEAPQQPSATQMAMDMGAELAIPMVAVAGVDQALKRGLVQEGAGAATKTATGATKTVAETAAKAAAATATKGPVTGILSKLTALVPKKGLGPKGSIAAMIGLSALDAGVDAFGGQEEVFGQNGAQVYGTGRNVAGAALSFNPVMNAINLAMDAIKTPFKLLTDTKGTTEGYDLAAEQTLYDMDVKSKMLGGGTLGNVGAYAWQSVDEAATAFQAPVEGVTKLLRSFGQATAQGYNSYVTGSKNNRTLEDSKKTNTYGLDFSELARAKDEASLKVRLSEAQKTGDTKEAARLEQEIKSGSATRMQARTGGNYLPNWMTGAGQDSDAYKAAVADLSQQEQFRANIIGATTANAKPVVEQQAVLPQAQAAAPTAQVSPEVQAEPVDASLEGSGALSGGEGISFNDVAQGMLSGILPLPEMNSPDILQASTEGIPNLQDLLPDFSMINDEGLSLLGDMNISLDRILVALEKTTVGVQSVSSMPGAGLIQELSPEAMSLIENMDLSTDTKNTLSRLLTNISANMPGAGGGGAFSIPPEMAKGLNSGIAGKGSDIIAPVAAVQNIGQKQTTASASTTGSAIVGPVALAPPVAAAVATQAATNNAAEPKGGKKFDPGLAKQREKLLDDKDSAEQSVNASSQKVQKLEATDQRQKRAEREFRRAIVKKYHAADDLGISRSLPEEQRDEKLRQGGRGDVVEAVSEASDRFVLSGGPVDADLAQAKKELAAALERQAQTAKALTETDEKIAANPTPPVASAVATQAATNNAAAPTMGPALPPANNRIDKFIASAQSSQLGTSPGNTPPTSPSQPVAPAPAPTPADLKSKQVNSLKALQAARAKLQGLQSGDPAFANEDYFALQGDVDTKQKEYQSSVDALKTSPQSSGSSPIESDADRNKRRALQEAMPFYEKEIKEGRTPFGNDGQPIDIVKKREELAKLKEPLLGSITPEQRKRNTSNRYHALADAMPFYKKEIEEGRTPLDSKGQPIDLKQKESELETLKAQREAGFSKEQRETRDKYKNKMAQNKTFGALTRASGDVENLEREHADSLGMSYGDLLADKEKIGTFRQTDKYKEAKQKESDARLAYRGVKDLPTVGDDFDKSGHRKNAEYAAMMSGRREAYLSKFRPEVREKMMTKAEKSARALSQAQAESQQSNSPRIHDPAFSGQFASVQTQQQTQKATKPTVTASGAVASTVPDTTLEADRKAYEEEKKAQEDKRQNSFASTNQANRDAYAADVEYNKSQHYTQEETEAGIIPHGRIVQTDPAKKAKQEELEKKRETRIAEARKKKEDADKKAAEAQISYDNTRQSTEQWNKDNQGRGDSLAQRGEAENKRVQLEKDRELVSTGKLSASDKLFGESAAMYGQPGDPEYMKAANEDKALQGKVARGETLTSEEQTKHDSYRQKEQKYYDDRMASARANVAANQGASVPSAPSSPAEAQAAAGSVITPTSSSATTPDQQKQNPQLARRMAYLSRFNPQARAAVIKKLPKAEQESIKAADEAASQQQAAASSPSPVDATGQPKPIDPAAPGASSTASSGPVPTAVPVQATPQQQGLSGGPGGPQGTSYSLILEEASKQFLANFGETLNSFGNNLQKMNTTPVSQGPVPTAVPASQMSQQQSASSPSGGSASASGPSPSYSITLDESSKQFLSQFGDKLNNFGSYVQQLSSIHIPDKIEMRGTHTVDVKISGAAAIEALDERMKKMVYNAISEKMGKIWQQSGGQLGDSPSIPLSQSASQV